MTIMRTWSARATEDGADDYHQYFERTLLPELRKLAGFEGAYLLCDQKDGLVELTAHTLWQSVDAIHAFAGQDITVSIVEPEARAVLLEIDPTASHRQVLLTARA